MENLLLMILGLAGGASLVIQASLNGGLRARLQSFSGAGLVSYLGGTLAMLVAVAIARAPLRMSQVSSIAPYWWIGGFFGAAYIGVSVVLIPRLGAATLVALIVAGQLLCSLVFDHFGFLGVPVHALDLRRLAGAVLLFAAVYLIRL